MKNKQIDLKTEKGEDSISINILREAKEQGNGEDKLWNTTVYDIGYGALAARIIRPVFDDLRMNHCAERMKRASDEPLFGRRRVADLLNKLEYPLALSEKRKVITKMECLVDSSMLEVVPDPVRRGLWLLLYGGAPTVAGIINDAGPAWYLDTDSYLRDLFLVQQLGRMGRMSCLRRLFGLYYGEFNVEESAYSTIDFPYHTIDIDRETVHWNTCPNPELQKFLQVIKNGEILYRLRGGS